MISNMTSAMGRRLGEGRSDDREGRSDGCRTNVQGFIVRRRLGKMPDSG